jgi:hypothetical protein
MEFQRIGEVGWATIEDRPMAKVWVWAVVSTEANSIDDVRVDSPAGYKIPPPARRFCPVIQPSNGSREPSLPRNDRDAPMNLLLARNFA